MDCFSLEVLESKIKNFKNKIVYKLERIEFNEEEMSMQSDLLSLVPEYSPKYLSKYIESNFIYNMNDHCDNKSEHSYVKRSSKTLIVEKKTSNEINSAEENFSACEQIHHRPSRISSRLEEIKNNLNITNFNEETLKKVNALTIAKIILLEILEKICGKENFKIATINLKDTEGMSSENSKNDQFERNKNCIILSKENTKKSTSKKHSPSKIKNYIRYNQSSYHELPKSSMNTKNLKIFIHYESDGTSYIELEIDENLKLQDILEKLYREKKIDYNHSDHFYFVEHTEPNFYSPNSAKLQENIKCFGNTGSDYFTEEINYEKPKIDTNKNSKFCKTLKYNNDIDEDFENEINLETQIKFLNSSQLDLFHKIFPDAPDSKPSSYFFQKYSKVGLPYNSSTNMDNRIIEIKYDSNFNHEEENKDKNDSYALEEYEVVKLSTDKTRSKRKIAFDRKYFYNLPANFNGDIKGTKTPIRKIKDMTNIGCLSNKKFFIEYKNNKTALKENGSCRKQIEYEVDDLDKRDLIVLKLKLLTNM